jgi:predicted nucleotidyltransferase
MLTNVDITSDEKKIIQVILQKYLPPNTTVWAFGSRVKGNAKKFSDLDLAIDAQKPLSFSILTSISFDLSESDLPYKIDIIDWQTTSKNFQANINANKVLFWEK